MKQRRRQLLSIFVVVALVAAACGGDDDETSSEPTATAASTATTAPEPTDVPVEEPAGDGGIEVTLVDIDAGVVTLTNTGDTEIDLTGYWLCNRPTYVELPATALQPGETIEISINGLNEGGGEIGLYSSSNFGSSDDIVSYVTWGGGGGRLSVAESAGIWSGDPVAPAGAVLTLEGDSGSADGWAG